MDVQNVQGWIEKAQYPLNSTVTKDAVSFNIS